MITVFYNSEEPSSMIEAKCIQEKFDNVNLVPDPSLKDIERYSKISSIVHFVTHHNEKYFLPVIKLILVKS